MRPVVLAALGAIVGCGKPLPPEAATPDLQEIESRYQAYVASQLAEELRAAVTNPQLTRLARTEREDRQFVAAEPMLRKLLLRGMDAEESLRGLIDDPSEDVRRATVRHLIWRGNAASDCVLGREMPVDLVVSLLEHALDSDDPDVREVALRGLAINAQYSDQALARAKRSLPKIGVLRDDNVSEVSREATLSLNLIMRAVADSSGLESDREAAAGEQTNLPVVTHK
jgi:hypothetical protein